MFLEKFFPRGKQERRVIEDIKSHIRLLCSACEFFKEALENEDRNLMQRVFDLEREGDSVRREIISNIYEGAFLPYLRADLCRFVEIVDRIFDLVQDTAFHYSNAKLPDHIKGECVRVAFLNTRICEMLLITFEAMLKGEDLREKTLAIRIYEKKVDDLKFSLMKDIRKIPPDHFWQGMTLSDFLSCLTAISDVIEDASDHLQIISASMKA